MKGRPKSGAEKRLFKDLEDLCASGEWEMSNGGTGAPGRIIEEVLGIEANNSTLPDAERWELKFHGRYSPITLFHKNGEPRDAIHFLVRNHGWRNENGLLSFRHTVTASGYSSRDFRVGVENDRVFVKHKRTRIVHWEAEDLRSTASQKLRNMILIIGRTRRKPNGRRSVVFQSVCALEKFKPNAFIDEIAAGNVVIDFDARESGPGSRGLRDHGTKFRVKAKDLPRFYSQKRTVFEQEK